LGRDGREEVGQGLHLCFCVIAEDVRGHEVLPPGAGVADADPNALEVRPEVRVDRAQAVMTGSSAADLHLHLEGREIELVMEDGERVHVELVEAQRLGDGFAAVVHEGLRLKQQDALSSDAALRYQTAKFLLPRTDIVHFGQDVVVHEANIVALQRIFGAWITKTDPELHVRHLA